MTRRLLEVVTVDGTVAREAVEELAQDSQVQVEVALSVGEEAVLLCLRPAPPPRPVIQEGGDPGLLGEEEEPHRGRGRGQSIRIVPGPRPLSPDIIPSQWAPPPPRPGGSQGGEG